MEKFRGLCIGGIYDGKMLASETSKYHIARMRQPEIMSGPRDAVDVGSLIPIEHETYLFDGIGMGDGELPIMFWRDSALTSRQAVLRLLSFYESNTVHDVG